MLNEAGVVVPPEDVDEFVTALKRLTQDADARAEMGRAARRYAVENLDMNLVLSEFEQRLTDIGK